MRTTRREITTQTLQACVPDIEDARQVGHPGGFKRTFRATWRGRIVAVQVLERSDRDRLEREITALRRIDSPHVVRLLEVRELEVDGERLPVFICEFIDGYTLEDKVKRAELYQDRRSLKELALGISLGLQAIHSNDLVHRDIKPANVMVRKDTGRAVILDLGIAKHLDRTTITHVQPLTPGWAAPEQLRNRRVDKRADLFSLGLVLHYAAVGSHPFAGGDIDRNILDGEPAVMLEQSHGARWQRLIGWLLQKEPYDRPREIDAVLSYLKQLE